MQGRLLPKYKERYQAHPVGMWQKEFVLAQQLGLDLIEFILDYDEAEKNPLMTPEGLDEITALSNKTTVAVKSVCADYFMQAPLHSVSKKELDQSKHVLEKLILNCSKIGVTDLVIPLVDQSSMQTISSKLEFVKNIAPCIEQAEKHSVNLALETDLSPHDFSELLKKLDSPCVTVNYDIGNSASLGYDIYEEFAAYGPRISNIHIKDRFKNGGSALLGTGNANFDAIFRLLSSLKYRGIFIMQAYRDDEGFEIFKKQLFWVTAKLDSYFKKESTQNDCSPYPC